MSIRNLAVVTLGLSLALTGCNRGGADAGGANGHGEHRRGMDFSQMTFPVQKADFIAKLNERMHQRCANPPADANGEHRGPNCATLDADITRCTASADMPAAIPDADAAKSASRSYFRCLRGDAAAAH